MADTHEALRLADALMNYDACSDADVGAAAAELRRLHAEVERLNAQAIDTQLAVRRALEQERTRCANVAARMTYRKRWIKAATNATSDNVPPCEIAAAILKGEQ